MAHPYSFETYYTNKVRTSDKTFFNNVCVITTSLLVL